MDRELIKKVEKYIIDNFIDESIDNFIDESIDFELCQINYSPKLIRIGAVKCANIEEIPFDLEEGFGAKLIEIIDEKGLKDSYVYKSAYMSRQLFNNIKNKAGYNPSKDSAIALIFPLELPYEECIDLLSRAGYTLTKSSKFDIIIDYCFKNGIYNLGEVNNILSEFGQRELGPN